MGTSAALHNSLQLDASLEVSYSILQVDDKTGNSHTLLQMIADAINVQFRLDEQGEDIPFVAPVNFHLATIQDKLFTYGPGGSGKSRLILELVRAKLDEKIKRLLVINPRQAADKTIQRASLVQLASQLGFDDIVVWDNFPDGLARRDIDTARQALEAVSSGGARNVLVALKPKFLETYRDIAEGMPDLYAYRVRYEIDQIKELVRLYGTKIAQFRELYSRHVAHDATSISKVLWQKEPFPLTIFNYYRDLAARQNDAGQLDALVQAKAMPYPTSYYEYQFEQLANSGARRSDAEFLYTVKLCYELALDRKLSRVEHLQFMIFASTPPEDLSRLGSWVYLSGQYVSMHDVPRDAIKFSDHVRLRITGYLIDNFSQINDESKDQLDSVGLFLGRNIQVLVQQQNQKHKGDDQRDFLPRSIYRHMKSNRRLEVAIGQGAGEVFYSLDQLLQKEILDRIEKDGEFARGLGESLGRTFSEFDRDIRTDILSAQIHKSILFARGLGESLGHNFHKLPQDLQDEVFQISLEEKNYNFQRGLGAGLGRKFRNLDGSLQKLILSLTLQHIAFAIGVGYGLALDFASSVSRESQHYIRQLMKGNGEMSRGLGMGLGENFSFLKKTLQEEILGWTDSDPRLEFGLAYQLSFSFTSLTQQYQEMVFSRVGRNGEFAYGSGWGFGVVYTYQGQEMQKQLLDMARTNSRFASGLGAGIGNQLQYISEGKEEEMLFSIIKDNESFAIGAGFGIGRTFTFLSNGLQDKAWHLMQTNHGFAVGLGWGLGFAFSYLHQGLQERVLEGIQKEPGFAFGFGWGLGFMFTYLPSDLQRKADLLALENSLFSTGFGLGLGSLFVYLPEILGEKAWEKARAGAQFALGFGFELGYLFNYLPEQLQQDILARADSNANIARGLGMGLGDVFASLPKDRQQSLLQRAHKNPQLLAGLGTGIGRVLPYLADEQKRTAVKMAGASILFGAGLGEGIGHGFQHLDGQLRQWAYQLSSENDAVARGLGSGMGQTIKYLKGEFAQEIWRRAEKDVQFAVGLGQGIGEVIRYLPQDFQDETFSRIEHNAPLSYGLGCGMGSCAPFYLTDSKMQERILSALAVKDKGFERGYGEGIGRIFGYWTEPMISDIIMPNVAASTQFAVGIGEGAAQVAPYDTWQSTYDDSAGRHGVVAKLLASDGFFMYGAGIGFSTIIEAVPEQAIGSAVQAPKHPGFAFGLGYGIGRRFASLNQKIQEDALTVAETNQEFAIGLGIGVGNSLSHQEPAVQQGLLLYAQKNEDFSSGLGRGVGNSFPSLDESLREKVLEIARANSNFAEELAGGLGKSIGYLDRAVQEQLASWAKKPATGEQGPFAQFAGLDGYFLGLLNRREDSGTKSSQPEHDATEILFSGKREKYCICYIDMMNSTQISATLDDVQLSKYYATFLNSMAAIAKNFGATIIKNAGDCLIYYFPSTSKNEQAGFRDVIECGITMISAHQAINSKLFEQSLPPLNYRISADYGKVEVAKSSSSQSEDLFGSTMNVCAKINSKAPANGMAIGHNLYEAVFPAMAKEYGFERIGEYSGFKQAYPVYSISSRQKRNILDPFRRPESTLGSGFGDSDDNSARD